MSTDRSATALRARVAFVTGASRGIGAAVALALAQRGIVPVLAVRNPNAAADAADAVRALGVKAHVLACDVTDVNSVRAAVARCIDVAGGLDIVVNNAGQIEPIGRLAEVDAQSWAAAVSVNLIGPFNVLHAALPHLLQSGVASIVNVSSGAAHTPREGWSAYCASKAALAMLNRSTALEYPAVFACGLQPGVVDTDMQVRIRASGINEISQIPRSKLSAPERPAALIAWLCDLRPADLMGQDLSISDPSLEARMREAHA